jgi:hypothetical protein
LRFVALLSVLHAFLPAAAAAAERESPAVTIRTVRVYTDGNTHIFIGAAVPTCGARFRVAGPAVDRVTDLATAALYSSRQVILHYDDVPTGRPGNQMCNVIAVAQHASSPAAAEPAESPGVKARIVRVYKDGTTHIFVDTAVPTCGTRFRAAGPSVDRVTDLATAALLSSRQVILHYDAVPTGPPGNQMCDLFAVELR